MKRIYGTGKTPKNTKHLGDSIYPEGTVIKRTSLQEGYINPTKKSSARVANMMFPPERQKDCFRESNRVCNNRKPFNGRGVQTRSYPLRILVSSKRFEELTKQGVPLKDSYGKINSRYLETSEIKSTKAQKVLF